VGNDVGSDGNHPSTKARHSRRSFLKGAGKALLLVGGGGVAGSIVTQMLQPEVSPRVSFAPASATWIHSVTIVDPVDGSVTPKMSIRINNGLIEAITPADQAPRESSEQVIDGGDRFAVPGYNDMHVHAIQRDHPELGFATMLAEGVTGIRQMLGTPTMLRNRAEQRLALNEHAPRLLQMPGALLLPFNAATPEEVREQVSRQWDQGADFIKYIQTSRDVFFAAVEAAHKHGLQIAGHLPPAVKMSEAAVAGFNCMEHLGTSDNLWIECSRDAEKLWAEKDKKNAMPSWIGEQGGELLVSFATEWIIRNSLKISAEKLDLLDRALATYDDGKANYLAEILVRENTWQSPTLVGSRGKYRLDDPIYRTDPWWSVESAEKRQQNLEIIEEFSKDSKKKVDVYHRYYEASLHTVGLWHRAGVKFLSGTDTSGRTAGKSLHLEFEELAKAGLSPLDILRSTTINPAGYLGRTEKMGRVAQGMYADIVLLDADPLASVKNLRSVSMVLRGGHAYTAGDLQARIAKLAGKSVPPVAIP
jgi:imidazolonepropionase-like amidohydrolase